MLIFAKEITHPAISYPYIMATSSTNDFKYIMYFKTAPNYVIVRNFKNPTTIA